MKPRIGDKIPEFMNLNALHMYMAAEYHNQSYSLEPPDEHGFKFAWLINNNTGAKVGSFPVAYIRSEVPITRYLPVITTNTYTEIAELYFAISYLERILGYYMAENDSDIRGHGFKTVDSIKLGLENEFNKKFKELEAS